MSHKLGKLRKSRTLFFEVPHTTISIAILMVLICFIVAALLYPGGTPFTISEGYALTHNMISDLGTVYAYSGQPNGALQIGLFIMMLLLGAVISFTDLYRHLRTRVLAYTTSITLVLVALVPSDLAGDVHNLLFFSFVLQIGLAYALLPNRRIQALFTACFVILLLTFHPATTDQERAPIATAQKLFVVMIGLTALGAGNNKKTSQSK
jgi:hypothetical membrane protein